MRKLLFAILGSCWLAGCHQAPAALALAYLNSTRVMQEYHGTRAKRQQLEGVAKNWQHRLDSLTTALGTSRLPAAAQQARVAQYRATLQQKMQAASQQADQELLQEVNQYLQAYGKGQHYDFILGATESGNIVYAAPSKDVTNEVVRGLNQQYDQRHPTPP